MLQLTSLARAVLGCAALIVTLVTTPAFAQKETVDDSAELAKKLQNPVAALISVPLQSNFGSWVHSHQRCDARSD